MFSILFFIYFNLKKKAAGKSENSSEYKSYQTFKVIMYIILVIMVISTGGIFGPELFSSGLGF